MSLTRVDGQERAVLIDLDEISEDQVAALGAIGRMAVEANLSLDKVAAMLSLESMQKDWDDALAKREADSDHG